MEACKRFVEGGCFLIQELKEFLDGAENGAILMSFGARERADKAGALDARAIMATFARLPQRVIWKRGASRGAPPRGAPPRGALPRGDGADDGGEDVLDNVMLRPWIPQNDVLGTPWTNNEP